MQNGDPLMTFGNMGGSVQPETHAQHMVNLIDHGMNVQMTTDAARFTHSQTGNQLSLETNLFGRSEEHTSELQSPCKLVCRILLEKKKEPRISPLLPTGSRASTSRSEAARPMCRRRTRPITIPGASACTRAAAGSAAARWRPWRCA